MIQQILNVKDRKALLLNPFYFYALFFTLALALYSFKWSPFPTLSIEVLSFLTGTIILSACIGYFLPEIRKKKESYFDENKLWKFSKIAFLIISIGFLIIFFNGGIPLFKIFFFSEKFDYQEYKGVKYLSSIVLYSFASLMIIWTHAYFVFRSRKYLVLLMVGLIFLIFVSSRGYTFLVIMPSLLLVLYHIKLRIRSTVIFTIIGIILLYLFGKFGDYREEAKKRDNSFNFYQQYGSNRYPALLPKEFLWGYFYMASPLAKFETIKEDVDIRHLSQDFGALTVFELLPYSIGNRLNKILKKEVRESNYIYPDYFVGTAFGRVFLYGNWIGLLIYTLLLFGIVFLVLKKSIQYLGVWCLPVLSILVVYLGLSVFDNMIAFAPINFQLFFTFLFGLFINRKMPKQA